MRILPLLAALLLLALSGIVHGLWSGRWGPSPDLQAAAARCNDVPMIVGDWQGHPTELDSRMLEMAEVLGYASRQYVNRRTKESLSILLICGRPGPISVHTPDICYAGAGYSMVRGQEHYRTESDGGAAPATFWTARFTKEGAAPDPLRIFWGWSDRGPWSAPANPRLAFARSGALYKLYVIRRLVKKDEPLDRDPCIDFLHDFLPELKKCLVPAS